MTNAEMLPNRFLRLANGRKLYSQITSHLAQGGAVQVCTYLKATQLEAKHLNMLKMDSRGSVYLQRGKHWDCIDHCAIRFSR
jgi:hypothetical protein